MRASDNINGHINKEDAEKSKKRRVEKNKTAAGSQK